MLKLPRMVANILLHRLNISYSTIKCALELRWYSAGFPGVRSMGFDTRQLSIFALLVYGNYKVVGGIKLMKF